jgi:selenocysteine lyase/cysteine desulfurase
MKVANLYRSELNKIAEVNLYGPEDEKFRISIVSFTTNKASKTILDKFEDIEIIIAERDIAGGKKSSQRFISFFNNEEEALLVIEQILI